MGNVIFYVSLSILVAIAIDILFFGFVFNLLVK